MRHFGIILLTLFFTFTAAQELKAHEEYPLLGKFRNTYYYVSMEKNYDHLPKDAYLLRMDDSVIAEVSRKFKRATDIEGTGKLLDGRVVNYAGRKKGEVRYLVTNAPFGLGVGNCHLEPFRTVAVDPRRIPLGSIVLIEETVGMVLPDGSVHDGLWKAEDRGGAIKKDRIDLFVAERRSGRKILKRAGIRHLQALTVRLVAPPEPASCVDEAAQ